MAAAIDRTVQLADSGALRVPEGQPIPLEKFSGAVYLAEAPAHGNKRCWCSNPRSRYVRHTRADGRREGGRCPACERENTLQHTRICAGQSPAGGAVLCACGPAAYFPTSRPSQVAFNRAPARSSTTQAPVMPPSWIARTSAHAICKSGVMVRRLNYQCASHVGAHANYCRNVII